MSNLNNNTNETTQEIWKDIDGFSNYQVSSKGNVRNKKNKKLLKSFTQQCHNYLTVTLYNDQKEKFTKCVHRLVAETFLPNPENHNEVNHKNMDTHSNFVENLEWCDHSWNMQHRINRNSRVGKFDPKTDELLEIYKDLKEAVEQNNPRWNKTNLSMCCRKLTNTSYGFKWKFIDLDDAFFTTPAKKEEI